MSCGRRPSKDETWLKVAHAVAEQSTCLRRAVGCVLVGVHGDVLATGYNGVASGQPHCNEPTGWMAADLGVPEPAYGNACPGARLPSGTGLDACRAMHAEANALVSCRAPFEVDACYLTVSPCVPCVKLLLRTPCRRVVFAEAYANTDARALWEAAGRSWELVLPRASP